MPTNCDKSESAPAAALVSFTGSSGCNWARTCNSICASSGSGCAVNIVSTNSRYARGVGTRPADACGLDTKPASSRSAMTLRIVAGLSSSSEAFDRVREPTGWPSAISRSISVLSRWRARASSIKRKKQAVLRNCLAHFSVRLHKELSAKTVWGLMRAEQAPSRSDGGDPAASPNTRNGEATPCKPLKNALNIQRINLNHPAHYTPDFQRAQIGPPCAQRSLQRGARSGLKQKLRPMEAPDFHNIHGYRIIARHCDGFGLSVKRGGCAAEKIKRRFQGVRLGAQQCLIDKRRQARLAALRQCRRRKASVIVTPQRLIQRMMRVARLNQHFPAAGASRTPSGLHQLGKKPLAGAKIMRKQGGVAIQDADERYALEIVPFRDHLRAEQNIHIARVHPVKEHLRAPFTACAIGVQTRNPRAGEGRQEAFFNALRAASKRG